jgi:hypothetical protein
LAAGVDDLVPEAGSLRTEAAFDPVESEFVNNQKAEFGIEADAFVDGSIGQGVPGQILIAFVAELRLYGFGPAPRLFPELNDFN